MIVPDTGSAYGGKHTSDAALEAARLSRAAGRPVKVVWTREEEFTWAYFRPAGVIEIKSGIAADGTLTAWEFHNYNSGSSGIETPYVVSNQRIEFHSVPQILRSGSYRGLAATANHFARETHMDALARTAQMDSLDFRLKNLADPRMRAVLEAAAKSFGWPRKKSQEGQGFGLAVGFEKGSYVATCAEVAVDRASGAVRVVRLVEAFECGAIVNPDGLRNQVVGAMIQGLGGALFEAIEFENGRIKNPHFASYRVPRFRDVPEIEAILARSQGYSVRRRRRNAHHDRGAGHRQRHLRRHRRPPQQLAARSKWIAAGLRASRKKSRGASDRFVLGVAQRFHIALNALWFARMADASAMPDQLVGKLDPLFPRNNFHQILLDLLRIFICALNPNGSKAAARAYPPPTRW